MIKKIINKRNYIILLIIITLLIFLTYKAASKTKEYIKTFNYFDETITYKIYSSKNIENIFVQIEKIYKKYEKYYKNPNKNTDKELIEILKYGKKLYKETNGLIDITIDPLIKNITNDKEYKFTTTINKINLKNQNTITNINISTIIGSYATKKVEDYLKKQNINKYIINQDGNIITKEHYAKGKYKISINDENGNILNIVEIKNKSMATKGNTTKLKPYMINPITSTKNKENKIVVVIANNINEANAIANTLYLMDIEDGQKFIKKYKAQAFWYTQDGKTYMTKNFQKYLKKTKK